MKGIRAAQTTLKKMQTHILVTGRTGTGKSWILTNTPIPDSRYFNFINLCKSTDHPERHTLCEENVDVFLEAILNNKESTLLLDSVDFSPSNPASVIPDFIREAGVRGKRLVIVAWPHDADKFKTLFGAVITLTGGVHSERECSVEIL